MLDQLPNEVMTDILGYVDTTDRESVLPVSKHFNGVFKGLHCYERLLETIPIHQSDIGLYSNNKNAPEYDWSRWANQFTFGHKVLINAALILNTRTPYKTTNIFNDETVYVIGDDLLIKQLPSKSGVVCMSFGDKLMSVRVLREKYDVISDIQVSTGNKNMDKMLGEFLLIVKRDKDNMRLISFINQLFDYEF